MISVKEIKDIRKKLDLTQFQLAQRSGVSQSLIAKIESGRLDPTYSNAIKIFNALNDLGRKNDILAEQIMSQKIISVLPSEYIKDAISKMKKLGFSQLPVIEDNKAIGLISESIILNSLIENKGKIIEDIMESPPPVISADTSALAISGLLKYFQMVLVSKKGKLIGVVTKTDLLANLYKSEK
jgi:predicted transcriptional regulator